MASLPYSVKSWTKSERILLRHQLECEKTHRITIKMVPKYILFSIISTNIETMKRFYSVYDWMGD